MISSYFEDIENAISSFKNIRFYSIEKKHYSHTKGLLKGIIIFTNNYKLEFMEIKDTDISFKYKYKYQLMDKHNNLIFRYDNAPHYPTLESFPHHKHLPAATVASEEPNFIDILLEIRKLI